jgi:hypothetical protein
MFCSTWEDTTFDGTGRRRTVNGVLGSIIRLHNPGVVQNKSGVTIPVTSWKHFALAPNVGYGSAHGAVKHEFWVKFFLLIV